MAEQRSARTRAGSTGRTRDTNKDNLVDEPGSGADDDLDPTDFNEDDDDLGAVDLDDDEDDDDLYDDDDLQGARTGYVTFDDLLGRLLVVTPTGRFTREGDNGEYDVIECDVIVCNGKTTDVIEDIPWKLEDFQLWGQNVVSTLGPALKHGRTVVGVFNQRKAKKFRNMAWHLDAPTEDQMAKAKAARKAIRLAERRTSRR